jgi:2'-hydroxyisoflavone reductase
VGDRLLIVRPGYIVGPNDPTHRFTYWVERCAAGGLMLGPSAAQPIQVIDVRDLAEFVIASVERQVVTTYHATAPDPALNFAAFLEQIAAGIRAPAPEVHWSEANDLLPLSATADEWTLMTADIGKARAAGLSWRPLGDTARDTLAWVREARDRGAYLPSSGASMTSDQERDLLGALAAHNRSP